MSDSTQAQKYRQLYSDMVRETLSEPEYGSWRSIMGSDAIPLGFGFPYPDAFPLQELGASVDTLFEEESGAALQYGGGEYASMLPEAVMNIAAERGMACTEDEIVLTNGATHAIDLVSQTFLDTTDVVFVEEPTFVGALRIFQNYGVDTAGCEMDDEGLSVTALEAELERRKKHGEQLPTLLYTIPNFQNPTGRTLSTDRRERLLELAVEYDFLIMEDDPYGELRFDGEDPPLITELDEDGRAMHVNTFSKTIAPGLRSGWIIADEAVATQLNRVNAGGANTFTRGIIARYWDDGNYHQRVSEISEGYRERRDTMIDALNEYMPPGTTWSTPNGGFFIWVECPEEIDTDEMISDAIDTGVAYLPGSMFYPDDGGENKIRLSFSYPSPTEIDRGIERLGQTVAAELASSAPGGD